MTAEVVDAAAAMEKAMHGKVTGIIIPPPGIREIVDKTAEFVAKNGKSFEEKILTTKDKKFNFMKINDPFHSYYEYKIREFEEGAPKLVMPGQQKSEEDAQKQQDAVTGKQQAAATEEGKTVTTGKASIKTPLAIFAQSKPEEPPAPYEFIFGQPVGLTPLGLDVLKLTAQYTAVNGREFLSALAQRELRNPQFDFLKPTHMLFSYFTALVDAYAKVLNPDNARMEAIRKNTDKMTVLERVVHRWQFDKEEEEKRKRKEQLEDEEKAAYQNIDWSDFVVVGTIEFPENEFFDAGLVPGTQEDADMDMDMDTDEPAGAPVSPKQVEAPVVEEEEEEIKVVSDYQPRMATSGAKRPATMIDPVSGKAVPVDQMGEHMRIQLMDPKWREEQQRFQEKQKETSFAAGDSIAASLRQFARQRGDIFGSAEQEEDMLREEQERRRRRVDDGSHVVWDGHAASAGAVQQQAEAAAAVAPPPPRPESDYGPAMPPPQQQPPVPQHAPAQAALPPPPPPPQHYGYQQPAAAAPAAPPPPQPMMPPMPFGPPPTTPMGAAMPPPMHMPQPPGIAMPPPPMGAPPPPGFPPAMMGGAPPPPPPPTMSAEPELIPEAEFAARFPGPIAIRVQVPNDPSANEWNLQGQVVTLNVSVTVTVKEVKEMLSREVGGMPTNRQQLKHAAGFLKDSSTLASYNIGDGALLEMLGRSRGGRR